MHPQDRLFCEIAVQLNLLTREQVAACTEGQRRDARGRSVAALALSLGFITQTGVDSVMVQQQRVLDRRREARAASRAQREVESRAGTSKNRGREPTGEQTSQARAPRRDPTPTTPWVHGENRAARLRSQPIGPKKSDDTEEVRETLDARPARDFGRSSGSREPGAMPHEAATAPGRITAPIDRPASAPGAAAAATAKSLGSGSVVSASAPTLLGTPAVHHAPPPPPPAAGVSQVSAVSRHNSPERTHFGIGPRDQRSPPFSAAATSAPLPGPPPPPPAAANSNLNATLLETSGREQKRRELAGAADRSPKQARPVPSGRDWRNPSRPPPPNANFDAVEVPPAGRVVTPEPGTGSDLADARRMKAPPLDTPHYIDRAIELCQEFGASDLHLHAGAAASVRVDGKLWALTGEQRFSADDTERILAEILDDASQLQLQLQVDGELRFVYELHGGLRARAHVYTSELGQNLVMRLLPREVLPPERLGLGPAMRTLREAPYGLCVCSGPAGSGKTTSLYAMARALAQERALHVVSIENPIEIVHEASLGVIEQREIGPHVSSLAGGIAWALRQNADVIVVSDLLAEGALSAALQACRARCLVLGGVRASSTAAALVKLMNAGRGDPDQQRGDLAQGLRLLLQQRLLPKARMHGRVAVVEQLVNTPQVAQLIRDDKLQQLPAVMGASKQAGTTALDDALDELVRVGTITPEAARTVARRSERFKGG